MTEEKTESDIPEDNPPHGEEGHVCPIREPPEMSDPPTNEDIKNMVLWYSEGIVQVQDKLLEQRNEVRLLQRQVDKIVEKLGLK